MQCKRCWYQVVAAWDAIQVELHGQYSLERLKTFHEYALSTNATRIFAVIVATPLPCILAIVVADSIPLEPPQRGINHSKGFWARCFFATFVYSHAIMSQIRYYVPRLRLAHRGLFVISIPVAFLTCVATYGFARMIGFPVPFTIPLTAIPWSCLMVLFVWLTRGNILRENRDVLSDLLQYSLVVGCQMSMVVVYPVFYSAFSSFSSSSQTLFALVLPVIKLVEKNLISRVLHNKDDLKPELVIFNVEIFNALFVSCCMQSSSSINTSLVIMAVDLIQACVSVRDLNVMLAEFNSLAEKMQMERGKFIETVMAVLRDYPVIAQHSSFRGTVTMGSLSRRVIQIVPEAAPQSGGDPFAINTSATRWRSPALKPVVKLSGAPENLSSHVKNPPQKDQAPHLPSSDLCHGPRGSNHATNTADRASSRPRRSMGDVLTADERLLFVQKALQILYLTEFLLLIEFTEVMIPLVYCIYLFTLFYLPNRVYYPQLAAMDEAALHATIQNVLIYGTMELCSFVILYVVLKQKLHISAIHQLAFVLEKQCEMVQSKLILWGVFMLQSTLLHLGADYSFKFEWLQDKRASSGYV
ncbi:hypothetical protein Gpo141_00013679 [Globisporangium polare]